MHTRPLERLYKSHFGKMVAMAVRYSVKICTFACMKGDTIIIKGARENNLKDISLEIPKHQITVFTGVSGSGKSSLVLDTIAAKSRRELNDTFPSFVQQYLPKYGRPHVDAI